MLEKIKNKRTETTNWIFLIEIYEKLLSLFEMCSEYGHFKK